MRIERSTHIAAPVDSVFAFVSDPRNDPVWCPKIRSVEQRSGSGSGPGARYLVVHRPIPVLATRSMEYALVSWDPPHCIEWHEDDGHDRITVTYTLESSEGGTRFTQSDDAELGAPRFMHPLMRAGVGRDIAAQLKRLRRHLEGR